MDSQKLGSAARSGNSAASLFERPAQVSRPPGAQLLFPEDLLFLIWWLRLVCLFRQMNSGRNG